MSDTFRDAIAKAAFRSADCLTSKSAAEVAAAILATPEMQAIKRQLLRMAHDLQHGCNDTVNHGQEHRGLRWWLIDELPDSVIEWVLS